ncbi:MAG: prolipoprotein diacylglyceryl transferase family protein [Bacteroidota bacterium]
MYPRISDLINDLLGTNILLPIQSFGFFVALAFLAAYMALDREVVRKTKLGLFPTRKTKITTGGPIKETDILVNFLVFGLLGYILGMMFEDYTGFARDPQSAIKSAFSEGKGSFLWALILGLAGGGFRLYQYFQRKNDKPVTEEMEVGMREELGTITTIAFVAGILGAKVFHNLEYWDDFAANPVQALLSFDGLTFYGGLIVATFFIARHVIKKGGNAWVFADAIAPAMMLSYGVGRIGCQTAGDGDWGIVNSLPKPDGLSWLPDWMWAFKYPHNVLKAGEPIPGCTGDYCMQLVDPVWPTPFYEIVMSLMIFAFLWAIRKRLPYIGQMTGIYLFFNGLERFWIEKIRVNSTYNIFGAEITQAEIISTVLMLGGITLFIIATYKWKWKTVPGKQVAKNKK